MLLAACNRKPNRSNLMDKKMNWLPQLPSLDVEWAASLVVCSVSVVAAGTWVFPIVHSRVHSISFILRSVPPYIVGY